MWLSRKPVPWPEMYLPLQLFRQCTKYRHKKDCELLCRVGKHFESRVGCKKIAYKIILLHKESNLQTCSKWPVKYPQFVIFSLLPPLLVHKHNPPWPTYLHTAQLKETGMQSLL